MKNKGECEFKHNCTMFEFFINETAQENIEAARRFSNSSDVGTFGGGGIVTVGSRKNIVDTAEIRGIVKYQLINYI